MTFVISVTYFYHIYPQTTATATSTWTVQRPCFNCRTLVDDKLVNNDNEFRNSCPQSTNGTHFVCSPVANNRTYQRRRITKCYKPTPDSVLSVPQQHTGLQNYISKITSYNETRREETTNGTYCK